MIFMIEWLIEFLWLNPLQSISSIEEESSSLNGDKSHHLVSRNWKEIINIRDNQGSTYLFEELL